MTIRIIRTASLGLPVGAIRTFSSGVEAALVGDKEAVYDTTPAASSGSAKVTADAAGNLYANGALLPSSVSGAGNSIARPPKVTDIAYAISSLWQYGGSVYQPAYVGADGAAWKQLSINAAAPVDIMGAAASKFAGGTVAMVSGFTGPAIDVAITIGGVYKIFTINILSTGELDAVALGSAMAQADAGTLAQVLKIYDQAGGNNHCALATATAVPCVLSGTIATNQLTATVSTGTVAAGQLVFGNGVTAGTTISSGASSPWTLSTPSTVGTTTTFYLGAYPPPLIDWDPVLGRYGIFAPLTTPALKRVLQWPQTMSIASAQAMGALVMGRGIISGEPSSAYILAVGDQVVGNTNTLTLTSGSSVAAMGQLKSFATSSGSANFAIGLDLQPMTLLLSSGASSQVLAVNNASASVSARTAVALNGGYLFSLNPTIAAYTGMVRFTGIAIFNAAPSAAQQTTLMAASSARLNAYPQAVDTLFTIGDSRTANKNLANAVGWPELLTRALGRSWRVVNCGTSSSTALAQIGDGLTPTVTGIGASLAAMKGAGKNYGVILLGVNDIGINSASVATVVGYVQTMCSQLNAVGIKPIVIAELATTSTTGSNPAVLLPQLRAALLSLGAAGLGASAVIDLSSSVPVMSPGTAAYYPDGLHPDTPVDQIIASAVAPYIV